MPEAESHPQPAANGPAVLANLSIVLGIAGFITGVAALGGLGIGLLMTWLITGLTWLAGLVLGLVAIWRTRSASHREGRGRAIIGVVVSWSALSVFTLCFMPTCLPPTPGSHQHVLAHKTVAELRTAIVSYYSEYKNWPAIPSASKDAFGDDLLDTGNRDLMDTLLGAPTAAGKSHNRRQIQFFSTRPAKMPTTEGLWRDSSSGRHHLLDPWGRPYHVLIDANRDNTIHPPPPLVPGGWPAYTNVAVWSYGKDGVIGGGDDVSAY